MNQNSAYKAVFEQSLHPEAATYVSPVPVDKVKLNARNSEAQLRDNAIVVVDESKDAKYWSVRTFLMLCLQSTLNTELLSPRKMHDTGSKF